LPRYVVFLRAINVGGRTIKMEALRDLFRSYGYGNVETFIASGNVILETDERDPVALEAHIEKELHDSLGYAVPAIARSIDDLSGIASYHPFTDDESADMNDVYYVWLLKDDPIPDLAGTLETFQTPDDLFHVHSREVYWLCRTKISQTTVATTRLEKAFGTACTMRNMNTINRVLAKYPPE
jgi:uncharacterized protein (DUF1697 family)